MPHVVIPPSPLSFSHLFQVINLPVTEALIERENTTQLRKWRETRGELQYKPSRRLHGSRAIHEERYRMNPPLTASASLLSLTGLKHRVALGSISGPSFSPAHSISILAESPSPVPPAAQNQVVVSEGLHAALPSPTGNNTPLGGPKKSSSSSSSNKAEKRKEKEREKQEKLQKEREKKLQKERERQEKEREKKQQKERTKEEAKLKKEKKMSLRKKEPKAAPEDGKDGETPGGSVLQDTYF